VLPEAASISVTQTPADFPPPCMGVSGFFQRINKLFLSEQARGVPVKEFLRRNAANAISLANMLMGMTSILCSLNG